jgi:hypothetical protein
MVPAFYASLSEVKNDKVISSYRCGKRYEKNGPFPFVLVGDD